MLENEKYCGLDIRYVRDEDAESPREWDNLGTIKTFHRRYELGDKPNHHNESPDDFLDSLAEEYAPGFVDKWENTRYRNYITDCGFSNSQAHDAQVSFWKEKREKARGKILEKNFVMLPVYLYDHSGITIKTAPFSCPWDSGQVGWVYVSREKILKEFSCKKLTKKIREKTEKILNQEIAIYDAYLRGEVYGWEVVDPETEETLDSCWGYIITSREDETYMENEARNSAKFHIDRRLEAAAREMQQSTLEQIPA